jgi:hypothetical protein
MKCDCQSNPKIKPFDACLFCAHKHASVALSLTNFLIDHKSIIALKICSQLNLSKWHLSNNFFNLIKENEQIVQKILSLKNFKNDLTKYVENLWFAIIDENFENIEIDNTTIFKDLNYSFENGMLAISNSIELLKFENSYKNINISYAIGQLVFASWCFQDIDINVSNKCRHFYKELEINYSNEIIKEMNMFLQKLWNIFLNKYIQ